MMQADDCKVSSCPSHHKVKDGMTNSSFGSLDRRIKTLQFPGGYSVYSEHLPRQAMSRIKTASRDRDCCELTLLATVPLTVM